MNNQKRLMVIFLMLLLWEGICYAQETSFTLPTATTGSSFNIYNSTPTDLFKVNGIGKVGIMQTNPRAQLEVGGYNGIMSTGTLSSGDILAPGSGVRFMWYPRNCAFRVGQAESNYWDDDGTVGSKLANYSIAMGYFPRATGTYSVAIGTNNYASGQHALALGAYTQALADYAISIGYDAWATGIHSVCIGTGLSTNGTQGSVLIGDNTPFARVYSSRDNEMTMRFTGGYRLWTTAVDSTAGVYMRSGQSGWTNYCDRNKKENFEQINFEEILSKIKNIPITKWNYKKCDTSIKYIGPMAQDFYAAFQLGGDDSLGINSICIDGVNMAGIKALIDRTDEFEIRNLELKKENEQLKNDLAEQKIITAKQQDLIEEMTKRFAALESRISMLENSNPVLSSSNSMDKNKR